MMILVRMIDMVVKELLQWSSISTHVGETFPWVGLTSPNTGTTCSSGCQNTGGTQTKIGPIASTTITKPCTCCSLPENSMVLQMRPLSATCKSVWPSFIDYNGTFSYNIKSRS